MSTIPLITGLDTRYNDRLRAPVTPIATTSAMILALDDSTGNKTVISAGYPATILGTVASMDSRLSYLETNSYESVVDVAYIDLDTFISTGGVDLVTIVPGDSVRTQDGAINALKRGGDKHFIADWIEIRPPQSTFTAINTAIATAQSTASSALSVATTVQGYTFSVADSTSTQRVYSYGTNLLNPQSTFTIPSATTTIAGLLSGSDKTIINSAVIFDAQTLTTTQKNQVKQNLDIFGTNISINGTSTNVQILSSTGTSGTISSATGVTAGVMSAADKAKLDGLPSSIPATDLSLAVTATQVGVNSSTGADIVILSATSSLAGVMSAADKVKLDGLPSSIPATDLSLAVTATQVGVNSSTGADIVILSATSSLAGVMSAADKAKLDGLPSSIPATNLSNTTAASTVTVNSSTGTGTILPAATTSLAGVLSAADKTLINTISGKESAITAGTTAQYWRGDKTWQTLDKTAVGLANVDNTSDASKPISTATATALSGKEATITAGTLSQYWRGDKTWQTLDKTAVGLANVDNTSDLNKPVSTATTTALSGKEATITAGTTAQYWRGDKTWQTLNKTAVGLANVDNTSDVNKPLSTATTTALAGKENTITAGLTTQYWRGDKTWVTLDKTAVGLANVDNTSDASKPISTATATALSGKEATITAGTTAQYWRGDKTWQTLDKTAVGLSNVDNTSDLNKPISIAVDHDFASIGGSGAYYAQSLTINGTDPTKFDVGAVSGWVVTQGANPTRVDVHFAGQTGIPVTNLATADLTYVALNSAGQIIQQTTPFTEPSRRQYIVLGILGHGIRTSIVSANLIPSLINSVNSRFEMLSDLFGVVNVSGNVVSAGASALTINKSAGRMWSISSNYSIDPLSPDFRVTAGLTPATFSRLTRSTITASNVTTIDTNNYDNAGTLTTVPSNRYVIHRVYVSPSNGIGVQYGQATYTSLNAAITAIDTESFVENPVFTGIAALRCFLIVRGQITSLTNAADTSFIAAGKFGSALGAIAAAGGVTNLSVANITTTTLDIVSDTGLDATVPSATITTAGLLSSADKVLINTITSKEPTITAGTTTQYWRGDKSWQTLDKTAVGLANVDNTSDLNKPVSTATTTAINTAVSGKENTITAGLTTQYWRGDKTWVTLDKTAVGLANVDNTSDVNKPVSTATTTAINTAVSGKENTITAGTLTQYWRGDKSWQTLDKTAVGLANVDNTSDLNKPVSTATTTAINTAVSGKENTITAGLTTQYWRGDKTWVTLDKTAVGLSNVDNTSDANKPISTATSTALSGKEATITAGTTAQYWRGDKSWQTLDKTAVGLANVDNTSDANKPVSTATATALSGKEATITAGTTDQYWRGDKTWQTLNKAAVGLANVDNTSDVNKPLSTLDIRYNGAGIYSIGTITINSATSVTVNPIRYYTNDIGFNGEPSITDNVTVQTTLDLSAYSSDPGVYIYITPLNVVTPLSCYDYRGIVQDATTPIVAYISFVNGSATDIVYAPQYSFGADYYAQNAARLAVIGPVSKGINTITLSGPGTAISVPSLTVYYPHVGRVTQSVSGSMTRIYTGAYGLSSRDTVTAIPTDKHTYGAITATVGKFIVVGLYVGHINSVAMIITQLPGEYNTIGAAKKYLSGMSATPVDHMFSVAYFIVKAGMTDWSVTTDFEVIRCNRLGIPVLYDVPSTGSAGATNLSLSNITSTTIDVLSDTGTDVTLPAATTSTAGLMTAANLIALGAAAPSAPVVENTISGTTYTTVASDAGKVIVCTSASPTTITFASMTAGTNGIVEQMGNGQITFAATGYTLRHVANLTKTAGIYSRVFWRVHSDNAQIILSGDMS